MRRKPKSHQKGAALITVLLVVSLVVISSSALLHGQSQQLRRTTGVIHGGQVLQYIQAVEDWAKVVIERDARQGSIDTLTEDWALELTPVSVTGGAISGKLSDAQARFNLNNLVVNGKFQPADYERFLRLLDILQVPAQQAITIADSLRDWMDPDQNEDSPSGAEDYYYMGLISPYRTSGLPMASASEIRLVKGMDEEIWRKLQPHVTALPGYRRVNVNTASAVVLQSLSSNITKYTAQDIIETRVETPFNSVQTFIDFIDPDNPASTIKPEGIGVNSGYFLLSASVSVADTNATMSSLIQREKARAGIVQRSFGNLL